MPAEDYELPYLYKALIMLPKNRRVEIVSEIEKDQLKINRPIRPGLLGLIDRMAVSFHQKNCNWESGIASAMHWFWVKEKPEPLQFTIDHLVPLLNPEALPRLCLMSIQYEDRATFDALFRMIPNSTLKHQALDLIKADLQSAEKKGQGQHQHISDLCFILLAKEEQMALDEETAWRQSTKPLKATAKRL